MYVPQPKLRSLAQADIAVGDDGWIEDSAACEAAVHESLPSFRARDFAVPSCYMLRCD